MLQIAGVVAFFTDWKRARAAGSKEKPMTSSPTPGPILGIETSCDETAAAVLDAGGRVLSNIISSQHDVHRRFGGVVPELASRSHVQVIEAVTQEALDRAGLGWHDVTAIAVTQGPGLAGALLVGLSYAKALAYALRVPLIGVSHLEGHIASAWIADPSFPRSCVILVVSGGHTHLYLAHPGRSYRLLGKTVDDAAGEAFDKGAQLLGLRYPGGPALDRLAATGDRRLVRFPRSYVSRNGLDFSFSGLKTSLLYYVQEREKADIARCRAHLAAAYQEAIVEVLVNRAFEAVRRHEVTALAVVGGVSANSRLRTLLMARAAAEGCALSIPPLAYCTDNAAMIAAAGRAALMNGRSAGWDSEAITELELPA
ncbi:MAG TPA: tRNA (adenosine(37)-N6)-threonylcarbamoyltransferase complex transferase subunit TsaD [Nitrospiraceae bacterium]|nr:tRNA (adenosine(37)-N6)-threonylcarbamoyltransferase complex transferase subunit TsaD [Nitrospiraceae bacterium]